MLDGVKAVAKAYGAVSGAVKVVRRPIQAVQDAIRDFVVKTLVRVLVQIVGEAAIAQIVTKVRVEKPFDLTVSLPRVLRGIFLDEDNCVFATGLINDALAVPLAAANLTLGDVTFMPEGDKLRLVGVFRLKSATESPKENVPITITCPQIKQ